MSEDARGAESTRITAAGRALAVLDVFGTSRLPLSTAEISRRSGLSMTTTHRLLHELLDWGAVTRVDDGRYELGTKLFELATASSPALRLRESALPALLRLHRLLRVAVVHLSIREGSDSVYVEALRSARSGIRSNRMGGRMPLHVTSPGRVLLAYADARLTEEYLRGPLASYTRFTETDPDVLRTELDLIRATQVSVTARQVTETTGGVAAPVYDDQDRVVGSVGVVLALTGHHLEDYLDPVRTAATQISRALTRRA
ncbi:MAG: IclR family transcriptional regulator [Microbacterium sp.]